MGHFRTQETSDVSPKRKDDRLETETCQYSEKNDNPTIPPVLHKCTYDGCQATFKKKIRLQWHIRQHTGERPFKCTVEGCDKAYTTSSHLKRHTQQSHSNVVQSYVCTECSLTLKSRQNLLKHHKRVHEDSARPRCPECGILFRKKNNLAEHITLIHTGELLSCDKCSKKFNSSYMLKRHQRSHNKTYSCVEPGCNAVFPKFLDLRIHRKTHVHEYKCTECEKSFAAKSLLNEHAKAHSNLLISCPYEKCHKIFSYQRNVDFHIRSVHLNIKVYCDICKAGYSSKSVLARHIEVIHMGKVIPKAAKKKERKKRKDIGVYKKSMVSRLTGVQLAQKHENALLKRTPTIPITKSQFSSNSCEAMTQQVIMEKITT